MNFQSSLVAESDSHPAGTRVSSAHGLSGSRVGDSTHFAPGALRAFLESLLRIANRGILVRRVNVLQILGRLGILIRRIELLQSFADAGILVRWIQILDFELSLRLIKLDKSEAESQHEVAT